MRGLPPVPPGVAQLRQWFDIGGLSVSVGFWLFAGSLPSAGDPYARSVISQWFTNSLPSLLELMHRSSIPTTCQLASSGLRLVEIAPPAAGAWAGGLTSNVALGIKWRTGENGRRGWALSYVPGVPDQFVDDNWRVNELALGNLQASARDLYASLNELPAPDGSKLVLGTLHRQLLGLPMPAAGFAPYQSVQPTFKLVTIRRRIPARGALSPA